MEKTQKTVIILTYCRVHAETGKPGKPGRYWFLEKSGKSWKVSEFCDKSVWIRKKSEKCFSNLFVQLLELFLVYSVFKVDLFVFSIDLGNNKKYIF